MAQQKAFLLLPSCTKFPVVCLYVSDSRPPTASDNKPLLPSATVDQEILARSQMTGDTNISKVERRKRHDSFKRTIRFTSLAVCSLWPWVVWSHAGHFTRATSLGRRVKQDMSFHRGLPNIYGMILQPWKCQRSWENIIKLVAFNYKGSPLVRAEWQGNGNTPSTSYKWPNFISVKRLFI